MLLRFCFWGTKTATTSSINALRIPAFAATPHTTPQSTIPAARGGGWNRQRVVYCSAKPTTTTTTFAVGNDKVDKKQHEHQSLRCRRFESLTVPQALHAVRNEFLQAEEQIHNNNRSATITAKDGDDSSENNEIHETETETEPGAIDSDSSPTTTTVTTTTGSSLEPDSSAVQLLSLALDLPWETGFRELQVLLQPPQSFPLLLNPAPLSSSSPTPPLSDTVDCCRSSSTSTDDDDVRAVEFEHEQNSSLSSSSSSVTQHDRRRLSLSQSIQLDGYIHRRMQFEPLQYICGQWDFLHYTLFVRPPLLCPRPETEELVQIVLNDILKQQRDGSKSNNEQNNKNTVPSATAPPPTSFLRVLDVGCGTGCIGIAIADQIPFCTVTALDVEPIAVQTATENAQRVLGDDVARQRYAAQLTDAQDFLPLQMQSHKQQPAHSGNMDVRDKKEEEEESSKPRSNFLFDLVVSNPPYIPAADMLLLDPTVSRYESATALYGKSEDGMDVIRMIVDRLPLWCALNAPCYLEVDPSHPPLLEEYLKERRKQITLDQTTHVVLERVHKDLCGRDRFVQLRVVPEAAGGR